LFKKAFYQGPHPRCKEMKMVSSQIATKIGVVGGLQNMDELLLATIEVAKVLGRIGETPYEPL
jgi:hypothetical protein